MFEQNEKLWKQKAEDYHSTVSAPENPETEKAFDATSYSREYDKRKAEEKAEREFVSPEKKLQDWQLAQVRLNTATARLKEISVLPTIQQCEAEVQSAQDAIEELRSKGGYEPLKVVPANPRRVGFPKPVEVAKAPETVEEEPKKRQCPICGIEILETQSYHRLPELGEYMYCVNNERGARRAGLNPVLVADNLERQRISKENE